LLANRDATYDAQDIREHREPPINPVQIDVPISRCIQEDSLRGCDGRRKLCETIPGRISPFITVQEERYPIRTMMERINVRLNNELGGRTTRVRGDSKELTLLMFGIFARTVHQLLRPQG
jgi:hypothetical protein